MRTLSMLYIVIHMPLIALKADTEMNSKQEMQKRLYCTFNLESLYLSCTTNFCEFYLRDRRSTF